MMNLKRKDLMSTKYNEKYILVSSPEVTEILKSLVEKAINAVVRDKNITEQEEVDLMAEAIEDAISKLEKKDNITNKPGEEDNDNIGVKPNPVPDGSNNENLSDSESVNTGDQSVIESYVGIGMLSLLGISLLILRKRK